jgi:hypothetical protein
MVTIKNKTDNNKCEDDEKLEPHTRLVVTYRVQSLEKCGISSVS